MDNRNKVARLIEGQGRDFAVVLHRDIDSWAGRLRQYGSEDEPQVHIEES